MVSPSSPGRPVRIGFVGVGSRGMAMLKNTLMPEEVEIPATWSMITALTEESAINKIRPVDFPDYTRGAWKNRNQRMRNLLNIHIYKNIKLKNMYLLRLVIILFLLGISTFTYGEISLPAIFGDHMVLQQKCDAAIWGKATAGKTVRISTSWDKKNYSAQVDKQGNWKTKVKTPKAGGPYEITISDGSPVKLKNVLIGEVWICSGQSNMGMTMKGLHNQPITGSNEAIATSANPNIRMITVKHSKSLKPKDDFSGEWKECLPENVLHFSATAYFFGRMIQQVLNVPVGLISTSWGGTRIEPWMSESGIKKFDWINLSNKCLDGNFSKQTPSVLFNEMVHPVVGYVLRGAIWYQGEKNREEPDQYLKLLPGLVENWRNEWGIGDFPFYYAQIAPYSYKTSKLNSAFLRDGYR
jgi:sialate O-acetylesterase